MIEIACESVSPHAGFSELWAALKNSSPDLPELSQSHPSLALCLHLVLSLSPVSLFLNLHFHFYIDPEEDSTKDIFHRAKYI